MHKVDTSTAASVRPAQGGAGPNPDAWFTPGDPATGVPATVPGFAWFNSVQAELSHVVTQNGLALDKADDTQLYQAIALQIAAAVAANLTPTGFVAPALLAAAPAGWLLLNGDTIGSAASAATHNDDGLEALFTALWTDVSDTHAPVSGGRGASAAADWAANKTLTLPDGSGRALIGAGTGAGLTARTLGDDSIGEEDHTLTEAELAAHDHGTYSLQAQRAGNPQSPPPYQIINDTNGLTAPAGGDDPHNNMQPSLVANWMIKS